MRELRDKVAVVTGAASGIGLAVSRRLATEGMRLVLADVEESALEAAAAELARSTDVLAVVTDVSEWSSVDQLRVQALERFGTVHLVHNNAGVGAGGLLWETSEEDWRWVLGVNLWGVVHGIRAFVPILVGQGEGHVVNTASLAGLITTPFMGIYSATKHAVVALSETLAKDLRTVGSPVGVSVLCPGFVNTSIHESERNRPGWAPAPPSTLAAEGVREVMRQLVTGGIDPALVADRVVEAVQTDMFYVLTHAESHGAVESRMRDILERRPPGDTVIA